MILLSFRRMTVVSAVLFTACAAAQSQNGWFPFSPAGPVAAGSAVDASDLLVDFAGEDVTQVIDSRGHLTAGSDGHFYFPNTGQRAKFFGANLMVNTIFPPFSGAPQEPGEYPDVVPANAADQLATRLARMGTNIVRLHFMDGPYGRPVSIWDPAYPNDTQHFDPLQVARLDYLIYTLKQHGIYCDLNLHAGRSFGSQDGVNEWNLFPTGSYNKPATEFDPVMIRLQEEYAAQLLEHVNPYTNLRLADDPAIAFVEISNEDSLLWAFANNQLAGLTDAASCLQGMACGLPPSYAAELDTLWNLWLRNKYGTDAALQAAWSPATGGFSEAGSSLNLASNGSNGWTLRVFNGAAGSVSSGTDGTAPAGSSIRVDVGNAGPLNWNVQLDHGGFSLENGQQYDLTISLKSTTGSPVQVDFIEDQLPFTFYEIAGTFSSGPDWETLTKTFTANVSNTGHVQMNLDLSAATGIVWIGQISLTPHGAIGVLSNESLAQGTVTRQTANALTGFTLARNQDLTEFYYDTQRSFFDGMNAYLKNTVGVKSMLTGSAVFGLPLNVDLASHQDFVDEHVYWDYPVLTDSSDAMGTWSIQNKPFCANPLFLLFTWASLAVEGKPFTVSESDESFPNDYAVEWLPWLTTFANFQDWDGLMPHLYGNWPDNYFAEMPPGWQGNFFFAISGNPIAAAQSPVASRVFLATQNTPAAQQIQTTANRTDLFGTNPGTVSGSFFGYNGFADWQGLVHSVRSSVGDSPSSHVIYAGKAPVVVTSDHGELTYDQSAPQSPYYTVNSPGLQSVTGFVAGRNFTLPNMSASVSPSTAQFASITLQPVDGQPLLASRRLLLSVLTRHENTGMIWNATRTSLGQNFGTAPSLIEPLSAFYTVRLRPDSQFVVYTLDAEGNRAKQIGSGTGVISFLANTGADATVWYEISALSTAAAYPAAGQFYYVVADHSGRCLDVRGGAAATEDGVQLQQWGCWGGDNQKWQFIADAGGGFEIASKSSGKAVDVTGGPMSLSNGVPIQQWDFLGGSNQLWQLVPTGDGYEVIAGSSGLCLDVVGGPSARANGVGIQQWGCSAGTNQIWQFIPAAN